MRPLAGYVAPGDTREGRRRRRDFWSKWGEFSQQEFWQDVGFDHDRKKDALRSGVRVKKGAPSGERPDFKEFRGQLDADEYFDADDALTAADGSSMAIEDGFFEEEGEVLMPDDEAMRSIYAVPSPGSRAGEQRAERARKALLGDRGIEPGRRAELLELLEDLGPEGLQEAPAMPVENLSDGLDSTSLLRQDLSRSLLTSRSYADAVKLKEEGMLPDGSYFAYLLNTRRVAKVSAEGKRISYSSLVVVGNGKGTAGVGMGKDTVPGTALYKATCEARKALVHLPRLDERTIFHAIDDRFAKTKLVIRLRRPGSGTRCSWLIWKILSAFGISDVSCKIHGSRNPTTVAHALMNALQRSSSAQSVAERRGLRVLDMSPDGIRVPGY